MKRAARLWRGIRPHVDTRKGSAVVALAALVSHTVETLVWPVVEGRDYVTYIRVYAEMWHWDSVIPWEMLWRMPVAPALLGIPLDLAGPWGARIAITVAYVLVVVAWFRIGMRFGPAVAAGVAAVLVVVPSFGLLFHRYSSDVVTAAIFSLLAIALVRAWERPGTRRFVVLGGAIAVMALTRPAHQVLVVLIVVPLVLAGTWRDKVRWIVACGVVALVPLGCWMLMNGARYDDRSLSRGGGAWLPFYRSYLTDRIIDPSNGPASHELANLVETKLLVREPYVSYGIDVKRFFAEPTTRYHEDLVGLSDRELGWNDRYALLRRAANEGIRRHPTTFASGLVKSFVRQLFDPFQLVPPGGRVEEDPGPIAVNGSSLPRPSEGGSIPAASFSYWLSRPDNAFDEEWTSPTAHHVVSRRPELLAQLTALENRVGGLRLEPSHGGSPRIALWLNRSSRLLPPALLWILVGCSSLAIRRPQRSGLTLTLAGAALLVLGATLVSVPPVPEFAVPFYPAFVLFGLVGLLGVRSVEQPPRPS
jgi:Dolichyl-phosphate-mannose-protein mannosyltransferase